MENTTATALLYFLLKSNNNIYRLQWIITFIIKFILKVIKLYYTTL